MQRRAKGLVKRVRFIKVPLSRVIAKNSRDKCTAWNINVGKPIYNIHIRYDFM